MGRILAVIAAAALLISIVAPGQAAAAPVPTDRYPYRGAVFTQFIADSYHEAPSGSVPEFYVWFEDAYARSSAVLGGIPRLQDALAARGRGITAARDAHERAQAEFDTAVWLYRVIKATIPRFSLSRGYEFVYTVRYGERQCLLQSVLVAGLLQSIGIDAGTYMVWKNIAGQESNNGHAVPVVRLADGRDVEIDPSEPEPVATHQGLFAVDGRTGTYRFVEPRFERDGFISGYRIPDTGAMLPLRDIRPLTVAFLRSQFYYYRGEQVQGGVVNGPATPLGLQRAVRYLERAQQLEPRNPLAVYVLGRVYLRQGRTEEAKRQYVRGYRLYVQFGHVPEGPRTAYAQTGRP